MLVFVVLVVVFEVVPCGSGAEACAKSDFIFLLEKLNLLKANELWDKKMRMKIFCQNVIHMIMFKVCYQKIKLLMD